jgi:integrase/recombinase XerC
MSSTRPVPGDRQLPRGHLLVLNRSFRRTLEAENKSPRTIEAYTDAVRLLATYCQAHGRPILAGELRRQHIQEFIADQLARWKPTTAHNRYRGLHAFFKWAVAEGDLAASPMDGMRPPQLPEQPVGMVRAEQLTRLLKTCEGRDFTSRRRYPAASRYRDAPGRMCRHDPGRCRPGPAHRVGARQGSAAAGTADRP